MRIHHFQVGPVVLFVAWRGIPGFCRFFLDTMHELDKVGHDSNISWGHHLAIASFFFAM